MGSIYNKTDLLKWWCAINKQQVKMAVILKMTFLKCKCIFLNENDCILLKFHWNDNKAIVGSGNGLHLFSMKPLPKPMLLQINNTYMLQPASIS